MMTTISKHDMQQLLAQQSQEPYTQMRNRKADTQYTQLTAAELNATLSITPTIDTLNNNNTTTTTSTTTATTPITIPPITPIGSTSLNYNTNNNNNNNEHMALALNTSTDASTLAKPAHPLTQSQAKRRSFLNFRSFDFHLKSIYSGLRNGNSKPRKTRSTSLVGQQSNAGSAALLAGHDTMHTHAVYNRVPPYLKIETVDNDDTQEAAKLLLDFPQSPYSTRRNSSHDDHRSSSQLLHINRYELQTRSQASSPTPSPYFLSPYAAGCVDSTGNIRRSSTSDINSGRRSGTSSTSDSRRPSTSDLLRRARERRGSEARMGRSVSHSGLPRGGYRSGGGGGGGGRRTSMAV